MQKIVFAKKLLKNQKNRGFIQEPPISYIEF
jgi:hypothetical protein